MIIIEAQIPEPVLEQARTLAEHAGIPLEQLISLAVTHSIGVWSHESYAAYRAKRGSREAFERALAEVPDTPPLQNDSVLPS